jgi:hypothetical protein
MTEEEIAQAKLDEIALAQSVNKLWREPRPRAQRFVDFPLPVAEAGFSGFELTGMAPKRRDPTQHAKVQAFIRKHGRANLPFGHTLKEEGDLIQKYIKEHGLTKIPYRVATMKDAKRWIEPGEQRYLRQFDKASNAEDSELRPVHGQPTDERLNKVDAYEEGRAIQASDMSLKDGKYYRKALAWDDSIKDYRYRQAVPKDQKLPEEGELAEGATCDNPECGLPIEKGRSKDARYCRGDYCFRRHAELQTFDKVKRAGQPAKSRRRVSPRLSPAMSAALLRTTRTGIISCTEVEPAGHPIENTELFYTTAQKIDSPNICIGVAFSRDHLLGHLLVDRAINFEQYEAGITYQQDDDNLRSRLRAPHRDILDINTWQPRKPRTALRLHDEPYSRVTAVNKELKPRATKLLLQVVRHGRLAKSDLRKLRTALDAVETQYAKYKQEKENHPNGSSNPRNDRRLLHRSL